MVYRKVIVLSPQFEAWRIESRVVGIILCHCCPDCWFTTPLFKPQSAHIGNESMAMATFMSQWQWHSSLMLPSDSHGQWQLGVWRLNLRFGILRTTVMSKLLKRNAIIFHVLHVCESDVHCPTWEKLTDFTVTPIKLSPWPHSMSVTTTLSSVSCSYYSSNMLGWDLVTFL